MNQSNSPDEMISVTDFAQAHGINEGKVIEMIKDGFYVGRIIDNNWYVSKTEENSESLKEESQGKHLFSFEGRITRGRYWGILAAILVVNFLTLLVVGQTVGSTNNEASGLLFAGLLVGLPCAWIAVATYVKRWHDLGKSGWMVLTQFIPYINFLILLYLGFAPGIIGANEYGEQP